MQELIEQAFSEAHKECNEKQTYHHAELIISIKDKLLLAITGIVLHSVEENASEMSFVYCFSEGFHVGYRLRQLEENREREISELDKLASK